MKPLGIAIWFVTPERKALLQQKKFEKFGTEIFQPIEAWVDSKERVEERVKRLLKEELGEVFAAKYSFRQLSQIKRTTFPIIGKGMATRYHFLGLITDEQLSIINSSERFKLVGKEDLPKIKKLSEQQKDPKEDIVLFRENQEILLSILNR